MSNKKCPKCSVINPFDAKFCSGCSLILDTKLAIEIQEAEKVVQEAHDAEIIERAIKSVSKHYVWY